MKLQILFNKIINYPFCIKTYSVFIFLCFYFNSVTLKAQYDPSQDNRITKVLDIRHFGANPNDNLDDTWAFIKASKYINNQWDLNGEPLLPNDINIDYTIFKVQLNIPAGVNAYLVGLQQPFSNTNINDQGPIGFSCAPTTYFNVLYNKFFTSTNSSSYTDDNGNTYYSYPPSTSTQSFQNQTIFDFNSSTNLNSLQQVVAESLVCSIGSTNLKIGSTAMRRPCSFASSPVTYYDPVDCVTPQASYFPATYLTHRPWGCTTPIFSVHNNNIQDPSKRVDGLFIKGTPNASGSITRPKIEYHKEARLGICDWNDVYYHIGSLESAELWPPEAAYMSQRPCFEIKDLNNLRIENIEIDGHLETAKLRGYRHDRYQNGSTGLYLYTANTTLKNLEVHHMQMDGLLAGNPRCDVAANLYIDSVFCHHNQRNGYSLSSGKHIRVNDSRFNENGKTPNSSPLAPYGSAFSLPASGVDIEFNNEIDINMDAQDADDCYYSNPNSGEKFIQDVEFDNCEFNFNRGTCLHNDQETGPITAKDISFINNCTFHKLSSTTTTSNDFYGIFIGGENYTFKDCKIWCPIKKLYSHNDYTKNTKFIDCDFEDKPFGTAHWEGTGGWLIELQQTTKPLFERCTFKVNDNYRQIFYYMGTPDLNKRAIFRDCNFLFNNQSAGAAYDPANGQLLPTTKNSINNANFQGNNSIQSIGLAACTFNLFTLKNCSFEGSTDACNPWVTEIDGNIIFQLETDIEVGKNDAPSLRYARLKLRNKGIIQGSYTPSILKIGATSSVEVEDGGSILASNSELEGNLIFYPGSYLHQNENNNNGGSGHVIKGIGSNANLFVSTSLNSNGYTVNPFYSTLCEYSQNVIGNPPLYPYMVNNGIQNLCVHGSNSNIANAAGVSSCIPNYSYISTSGSFIVMYNVTNALCNGGNGQLDVSIFGGVAGTFEYSIDNGVTFLTMANTLQFPAGNYNIIIKDANGANCGNTFSFDIEQPDALSFSSTSTTNITCNNVNIGAINTNAIGGVGAFTYTLLPTNVSNTTGEFSNLSGGVYTVVASDANNCSVSQTLTIVNPNIVAFNTTSTTNINCYNGNDGIIDVAASGGTGALNYTILPNNVTNTTGYFSNLGVSVYTVVVSDANNCSASSSINITQPNPLAFNTWEITNKLCDATLGEINVQAGGGIAPYTYNVSPNAGVTQTNNIFTNIAVGTYTVSVTDANGCVKTSVAIINEPQGNHCCSPAAEAIVATPNVILLSNTTASDIRTNYNSGSNIVIGKTFYIDGTLTIDEDITFDGCTMWFAPYASVYLDATHDITITANTLMQASCDWWGGIVAQNAANKVSMNSGSTIKNSSWGILAKNNAIVEIDGANFVDNGHSCLSISDMNLNPYPGFIKDNTFTTQNNLPGPWNRTLTAIQLTNVREIKIGGMNNGNSFDGMRMGIYMVENGSGTNASNEIEISNNSFTNIYADDLTNGIYFNQETAINNTCYTQYQGSVMFAYYSTVPTFQGNLIARSNTINQCDKAIVNLNSHLMAEGNVMTDCQLGIMNSVPLSRHIDVINNTINNSHIGIEVLGSPTVSNIVINTITSAFGVITGVGPVQKSAPIGIKYAFNAQSTNTTIKQYVANNTIKLNSIAGIGIYNIWGDGELKNEQNNIDFLTSVTTPASYEGFNTKSLWGIWNDACWKSTFEENTTLGNSTNDATYWNNRDTKGMYFAESEGCVISCNKAKYTRYGFLAKGKNETDKTNVKFNKFNANAFPWFFIDGAVTGSFGDVGAFGDDGRNEFIYAGGGGAIDRRVNGYKLFTNTSNSNSLQNQIWTDPSLLTQTEIGPIPGFTYFWSDALQGATYTDPCIYDPTFIINPSEEDGEQGQINLSDELVVDIITATNQNNYVNFADVATYIDQKKLYKKLDENINYRNSNASLLNFYNMMNQSTLGQIIESEKAVELLTQNNLTRTQYESLLTDAITKNNNIVANYNWEVNEQNINAQTIQWINKGIDSIESTERASIEALAKSCVFTDGPAVYKARAIHSNFEPDAIYDDRVLCITTQNRGGSGTTDVDSLMLVNTGWGYGNFEVQPIKQNEQIELIIYPNPTSNNELTLTHTCNANGFFVLFNMLGQELMRVHIDSKINKIALPNLINGIYTYKCEFYGCSSVNGSIKIIK